jgi:hypothetical protein
MTLFTLPKTDVDVLEESIKATGRSVRKAFARAFPGPSRGRLQSKAVTSIDFEPVRTAAAGLPGVEEATSWGAPALKAHGTMFVCQAINKAAEPNTLVVRMDIAQRDALIEEDPDVYYLKEHYIDYPCVLVRLSRVHPDALRDLVQTAYRFVSAKRPQRRARGRPASPRRRTPRARRR